MFLVQWCRQDTPLRDQGPCPFYRWVLGRHWGLAENDLGLSGSMLIWLCLKRIHTKNDSEWHFFNGKVDDQPARLVVPYIWQNHHVSTHVYWGICSTMNWSSFDVKQGLWAWRSPKYTIWQPVNILKLKTHHFPSPSLMTEAKIVRKLSMLDVSIMGVYVRAPSCLMFWFR